MVQRFSKGYEARDAELVSRTDLGSIPHAGPLETILHGGEEIKKVVK